MIVTPTTPSPSACRGGVGDTVACRRLRGSCVLDLAAGSDPMQQFDGGDGTVAIYGLRSKPRGPLGSAGSADSHGCICLSNDTIDWLMQTIGPSRLSGTPGEIG